MPVYVFDSPRGIIKIFVPHFLTMISAYVENSAVRLYFLDQTGYKYHVSPK